MGFSILKLPYQNKCALFFISLVKSYYCPYHCLGGGVWEVGVGGGYFL